MSEETSVLEVENLTISLDRKLILKDISFSLHRGEALAIVGPNGAGKTVLFRALLGEVPYTGKIRWQTNAVIGYVPQRFGLAVHVPLTVHEFFLCKAKRFWFPSHDFVRHLGHELSAVGLTRAILKRQLSELSGGELQRILISWALVGHPNILLFDEPTTGIDADTEETIYDVIERLRRERHTACILISHDIPVVSQHADRVLSMNRKTIAYGSPEEVLSPGGLARLYGKKAARRISEPQ